MKTLTGILALSLWLTAATAAAQQPLIMDSVTTDSSGASSRLAAPDSPAPGGARGPYKMPPLMEGLLDDLHNKLIHFPIVLTLVAAVMVIVARKKPQYEPVAFWLVTLAALSVIPAYFSGKAAEEHFEGKPKEWLVELHEKVGITIGILEALWVLSLLKVGTRRFAWVIGVILAVMVSVAGYLGGLVAHGH